MEAALKPPAPATPPVPGLPADDSGAPVFDEPWQARAFALTLHLHSAGLFTWPEWAAGLGREIAADPTSGNTAYWNAWTRALETLLSETGLSDPDAIAALTIRWQAAAHATPHGSPVRLGNADP